MSTPRLNGSEAALSDLLPKDGIEPVCAICGDKLPENAKDKLNPFDGQEYVCCPGCVFEAPKK